MLQEETVQEVPVRLARGESVAWIRIGTVWSKRGLEMGGNAVVLHRERDRWYTHLRAP